MKKIGAIAATLLLMTVPLASCKKKEQPPVPPPMQEGAPGPAGAPHGEMGGVAKKVTVPPDVKAAWKSVKIDVEFKAQKKTRSFSIPLNSEFKVPDSDLAIRVGDFLPHFAMTAESITSNSNKPENPAVQVEVLEKGNQLFKGWLFSKFPDVHPFQHEKYGLKLVAGEKK
ncbi:MAG: DUF2155 domain-containing protein [Deltaproteobacteria bacterium]